MSRIRIKFDELINKDDHPLIGYMVAGYPELNNTNVINAMIEGGVDILEIGIPFSDPIADGKTIQRASYKALKNGMTPSKALKLCKSIKDEHDIPLAIMTYTNILYSKGYARFIEEARENGVDAFIVADLIAEEASDLKRLLAKHDMDLILLASPNTNARRIRLISSVASGFLYLVSVYGTTGERSRYEDYTIKAIRRVKRYSKIPVGVGFGVSKPEHVRFMIDAGADAVIVGSAFINALEQGLDKVKELASSLKSACSS